MREKVGEREREMIGDGKGERKERGKVDGRDGAEKEVVREMEEVGERERR